MDFEGVMCWYGLLEGVAMIHARGRACLAVWLLRCGGFHLRRVHPCPCRRTLVPWWTNPWGFAQVLLVRDFVGAVWWYELMEIFAMDCGLFGSAGGWLRRLRFALL